MEYTNYSIGKWCTVENEVLSVNGKVVFEDSKGDFAAFAKAFYKSNEIEYPKFFKMDLLSKLAFIGAEAILGSDVPEVPTTDIALLLSNASSSLDTDFKHSQTIVDKDNYYPSPAIFVYTLANICLAEVSIRHKLQSENAFFVTPDFDVDLMFSNATYLLQTKRASKVLCGWVEYLQGSYRLFFYIVQQHKEGEIEHTKQNIIDLYTTKWKI